MIIEENDGQMPLPLYDVEEVTVEEALCLLSFRQKYYGEPLISRAGNRLRMRGNPDKLPQTLDRFFSIWGPSGAHG
jgi:hypothetical protein